MKKHFLFINLFIIFSFSYSQTKPNLIPDLTLWLRADSNLVLNGSNVSQWNDCSGNSNNALQSNSTYRPLWVNNSLNGHPILSFDGTNDFFDGTTISNLNNSSISIFIVANASTYSGSQISPLFGVNCYPNQFGFCRSSINQAINVTNTGFFSNGLISSNNSLPNTGYTYKIFEYTKTFSIISKIYSNGNILNTTTNSGQVGAFTNGNYYIGLGNGGCYLDYYKGNIAEIIIYTRSLTDLERQSVEEYLRIKYAKHINLGVDINIPYGFQDTTLNAGTGFTNYFWNTGNSDSTITVNKSGTYWVQANDLFNMPTKDTINVSYPNTKLNYSNDTSICYGSLLSLGSKITNKKKYSFLWSNGLTDSIININSSDQYWVRITDTNGYFSYSDTINIIVDNYPNFVSLGNDTAFCAGNSIGLVTGGQQTNNYLWSTLETSSTIVINATDTYSVTTTNELGCTGIDSIYVTVSGIAPNPDFSFVPACSGYLTSFTNTSIPVGVSWSWDFGDGQNSNLQSPLHSYINGGSYNVKLIVSDGTCSNAITKPVNILSSPVAEFSVTQACINNPYLFIDQSMTDLGYTITSWEWDFGDATAHSSLQNPTHLYTIADNYTVSLTITSDNSCQNSISHSILVVSNAALPAPPVLEFPTNNYTTADTNITFSWLPSQNADRYKILIASDVNFNSIITQIILDSTKLLYNFSNMNQQIFWKVRSFNICSDSSESNVFSFNIFSPGFISGLNLWLKADGVIIKDTNNYVSQWNDCSGNNNNASQTVSTSKPLMVDNGINEQPVLYFDGGNDFLTGTTINNINNSSLTIFIVANADTYSGSEISPLFGINCYPNQFEFSRSSTNQALNISNTGFFSSGLFSANNSFPNSGFSYKILEYTKDINLISKIYNNGTFLNSTTNTNQIGSFSNGDYYLGQGNTGCYLDYYHGKIAEIIVFNNVLSDTNRINIENYLLYKYAGPPVNLGPDINIAYGLCDTTLDAGGRFTHFLWSTGDTTQTISITQSGQYSVTATNIFEQVSSDTIIVNIPNITVHDTAFCLGNSLTLSTNLGSSYNYLWLPDSVTTETFTITQPGNYSLSVFDTISCQRTIAFTVTADSFAIIASLGPDRKICQGDILTLTEGAQQAVSYFWSDNSGNNYLPINAAPGNVYDYSLTVTNNNGCVAVDTINLNVNGVMPAVSFTSDSVCFGNENHFTDFSSVISPYSITSRLWDFGDSTNSSLQNPTHTYSDDGVFNVTLTVTTDSGCVKSFEKMVKVFSMPQVSFLPYEGCSGVEINFIDNTQCQYGNLTNWHWDFGDTFTVSSDTSIIQNPTYTYDTAGTFTVKLTAGSQAGCVDSTEHTITIKQSPFVDFAYTTACATQIIYFTDQTTISPWETITEYKWAFGDGSETTISNPSHFYDTAGTYNVTLTVKTLSGCEVSITKVVMVGAIPNAEFAYANNCMNSVTQFSDNSTSEQGVINYWQWDFQGSGTSSAQNPGFVFTDTGNYNVTLLIKTDLGCTDSISMPVRIYPLPNADFIFTPEYGVPPLPVDFTNLSTGASHYLWAFGDGDTTYAFNPDHTYLTQGIFNVLLTAYSTIGCKDTAMHKIYVQPMTVDILLYNASAGINNSILNISSDLLNIGSRKIEHIDFAAQVDNGNKIHEQWYGSLIQGESIHYVFTSQMEIPAGINADFVCVSASLRPELEEENVSNNLDCPILNSSFKLIDPYPNPLITNLTIDFILPFSESVQIELFDELGHKIKELFNGAGNEGYNTHSFDLSFLNAGVYTYKISFHDTSLRKKFVKM